MTSKSGLEFKVGDAVVYPAHGVGKVAAVEVQEVAGMELEVYVVTFDHEKMTLRVPTKKAKTAGLRTLAAEDVVTKALTTLKGCARIKRTMWSRRAQEYEAKINSGDPIQIAEVVRDLHRNAGQPDQSFSERQAFAALAQSLACPFHILAPEAPIEVLRARITARQTSGKDASEATQAVLKQQLGWLEPLAPEERLRTLATP